MARTPDLDLHAVWCERIHRQASSGLTIARFCNREALSPASFHSWKRRLRLADLTRTRPTPPAAPAFLPVTVSLPRQQDLGEAAAILADLPNGVRLHIPTADPHLARRIVLTVAKVRTDDGGPR